MHTQYLLKWKFHCDFRNCCWKIGFIGEWKRSKNQKHNIIFQSKKIISVNPLFAATGALHVMMHYFIYSRHPFFNIHANIHSFSSWLIDDDCDDDDGFNLVAEKQIRSNLHLSVFSLWPGGGGGCHSFCSLRTKAHYSNCPLPSSRALHCLSSQNRTRL